MPHPDRTTPPPLYPYPTLHLPTVERFTLDNGVKIVNVAGGDMPGCRIDFQWSYGSVESASVAATRLMFSTLNQGTDNHSSAEIADILDYNGAMLSTIVADHTSRLTLFALNESLERLLPLIDEIVNRPTFPSSEFTTLRDNMVAKTRVSLQQVARIALTESAKHSFGPEHPYARFELPEQIAALTRDDILKVYNSAIKGVAPTVYITGMTAPVLPLLTAMLSKWQVSDGESRQVYIPANPAPGRYHYEMPESQQSAVRIAIPTIDRSQPDYVDLRVAIHALGGYFGSRLMSNIREEKGYTYGISGALYGYREGGFVVIKSECDPKYVDDLIKETFHEIDRLAREPMDEVELQNVRNSEINSLISTLDTPFSVCDYILSCDNNGLTDNYYERQMITATSITADRISSLISTHLDPSRAIIQTVGRSN